jgi:hypothetical protein
MPPNPLATVAMAARADHDRRHSQHQPPPPQHTTHAPAARPPDPAVVALDPGGQAAAAIDADERSSKPPDRPRPPQKAGDRGEREPTVALHRNRTACRWATRAVARQGEAGGGQTTARVGATRSPSRRRPERLGSFAGIPAQHC